MSETTPDPAQNKPSQAEGDPGGESVEPAVAPEENMPSQAEGSPEDVNAELAGDPGKGEDSGS